MRIALQSSSSDGVGSLESPDSDSEAEDMKLETSDSESGLELDSSDSSDFDRNMWELEGGPDELLELYFIMETTRYLFDKQITPKSTEFARQYFHDFPEKLFRQITRMDKRTFFHLVDLISGDPVFKSNPNHNQTSVESQLAVTLDRLGHNGNGSCEGSCLLHMIPTWGVSNGSLCNFSKHCFTALERALADQVKWSGPLERATIAEEFAKKGFPGCVGLIDGSLLPLSQRPKTDGECYFDRKSQCSINSQIVCDHRRKILMMFSGMPGSCADLTCLRKCPMWRNLKDVGGSQYFAGEESLLGDSSYVSLPHLICAFKRTDTGVGKSDFNTCVAKCRVTNEHCIGVLKARWHSLKEIRVQLKSPKDNLWMMRWIHLCARLHNFVIKMNDDWTEEDGIIEVETDDLTIPDTVPGRMTQRRNTATAIGLLGSVMATALAHGRGSHGFLAAGGDTV